MRRRDQLRDLRDSANVQVVVKPHPQDAADFNAFSLAIVTDEDLVSTSIGLYQLLARTSALVTDYSSISTD